MVLGPYHLLIRLHFSISPKRWSWAVCQEDPLYWPKTTSESKPRRNLEEASPGNTFLSFLIWPLQASRFSGLIIFINPRNFLLNILRKLLMKTSQNQGENLRRQAKVTHLFHFFNSFWNDYFYLRLTPIFMLGIASTPVSHPKKKVKKIKTVLRKTDQSSSKHPSGTPRDLTHVSPDSSGDEVAVKHHSRVDVSSIAFSNFVGPLILPSFYEFFSKLRGRSHQNSKRVP